MVAETHTIDIPRDECRPVELELMHKSRTTSRATECPCSRGVCGDCPCCGEIDDMRGVRR